MTTPEAMALVDVIYSLVETGECSPAAAERLLREETDNDLAALDELRARLHELRMVKSDVTVVANMS